MKRAVLGFGLVLLSACRQSPATVDGQVLVPDHPAVSADIAVYGLGDSAVARHAHSGPDGSWHLELPSAGSYLRIASWSGAPGSALQTLRSVALYSKELQQLSAYDAVSNMPDELKAALAFGPGGAAGTGSPRSDSLAAACIGAWPASMHKLLPGAGKTRLRISRLEISKGAHHSDTARFDIAE